MKSPFINRRGIADHWVAVNNAAAVLCAALAALMAWLVVHVETSRGPLIAGLLISTLVLTMQLHLRRRLLQERGRDHGFLHSQRAQAEFTLHSIMDAVITTDAGGRVANLNQSAEQLTGWTQATAQGRPIRDVFQVAEEEDAAPLDPIAECLAQGRVVRLPAPVPLLRDGLRAATVEVTASPLRNRRGGITGAVLVFNDISRERQMEDRLAHQARHDFLTGLVNRREFERLLSEALSMAARDDLQHALCYMDLDHFKVINDTCGHTAGDELLVQLSALLRATVRGDDLLARLGGDEFAVLLYDCPLDEAAKKADALRLAVQDFRFVWAERTFDVGFGIGVVAVDAASGNSMDVLRAADSACYAAKARGRNKVFVYQPDDPELQRLRGEMRWVTHIGDALRNQQFQLYYQLIQPLQAPEPDVFHCELLMRAEDDRQQLISPEAFIPTAERYKLVTDLDRWVISSALTKIAELDRKAPPGKSNLCGINLSGQSLSDESFRDYVKGLFKRYQVRPASVCFEITETTAISNLEHAIRFMRELKALGCAFALDDFGAGVSSYTYLKKFPLDYVKIDGSFIRAMLGNPVDLAMVESVVHIAKVMGIKTVAEFVEDAATLARLRELGVDYAQGYGIARPQPLGD